VDVDAENVRRILARADAIEAYTGIPRAQWFTGEQADDDFPGGRCTRTQTAQGACVFLSRAGQGCLLHSFANANGLDYHELKPMVSSLFPLTFAYGALLPSAEIRDGTLVCLGRGPTLYGGIRRELAYYFGGQLIAELDELEVVIRAQAGLDSAAYRDGKAQSP
jgi:hypothetical protein